MKGKAIKTMGKNRYSKGGMDSDDIWLEQKLATHPDICFWGVGT